VDGTDASYYIVSPEIGGCARQLHHCLPDNNDDYTLYATNQLGRQDKDRTVTVQ